MVNLRRKIEQGVLALGATRTINLPREHFWRQIHLEIWYSTTDPGTGVANANRVIHDILKNASIRLGGATVPYSLSGISINMLNQMDNGVPGNQVKGKFPAALHAVGNADVTDGQDILNVAHYWIDFNLAPTDQRYMIPSGELASFDLILDVDTSVGAAKLFTTDFDVTPTFYYRVTSWEKISQGVNPKDLGLILRREFTKAGAAVDNVEFKLELPLGNIYRRLLVYYKDANLKVVNIAPTDNVTDSGWTGGNTIGLPAKEFRVEINGIEVLERRSVVEACLDDQFQYGVIPGLPYGVPSVDMWDVLAQNQIQAVHIIDFDLDIANLDDIIDSANLSSFELIWVATATAGFTIVVTEELRPV